MRRGWSTAPQPILDLDARYVETSGGLVTRWPDLSGMGNHATPPADAPVVESSAFGSLPGVRFGRDITVNDHLRTVRAPLVGNAPVHIFVVYKPHAEVVDHGLALVHIGDLGPGNGFNLASRPGPPADDVGDPSLQGGGIDGDYGWMVLGKGNTRVIGKSILGEGFFDGDTAGVSYNGLPPVTVSGRRMRVEDLPTKIGNREGGNPGTIFHGHIGRIRVYPQRLSEAWRAHVCDSIMDTWSVP